MNFEEKLDAAKKQRQMGGIGPIDNSSQQIAEGIYDSRMVFDQQRQTYGMEQDMSGDEEISDDEYYDDIDDMGMGMNSQGQQYF